ncbi:hypothetical protein NL529_29655, partial [Klebsiella pneumoniae]|nr:hypothetical protein [Klebsiella pneumoniae]
YMDEQARMHDIRYYNITNDPNLSDEQKLAEKHKADEDMIRAVEKYEPGFWSFKEKFFKWVILNCLKFKVLFGMGLTEEQIAKESPEGR